MAEEEAAGTLTTIPIVHSGLTATVVLTERKHAYLSHAATTLRALLART